MLPQRIAYFSVGHFFIKLVKFKFVKLVKPWNLIDIQMSLIKRIHIIIYKWPEKLQAIQIIFFIRVNVQNSQIFINYYHY